MKAASIINRFLISTIAPKTRKAINDPNENVLLKEDAMNASTSEQSDKRQTHHHEGRGYIILPDRKQSGCFDIRLHSGCDKGADD